MRQTIKRYIENSSASLTDKAGLVTQLDGVKDRDLSDFYEKVQALLGGVTKSYSSKRPTTWNTR
jgi:hypothetical protein